MKLANDTPHEVKLMQSSFGEDRLLAAVIVRPTFEIVSEALVPTSEEIWPVEQPVLNTPYGKFQSDTPFLNGGIDVFVAGRACQPGGRPGSSLQVEMMIGSRFYRKITVLGNRIWKRHGESLQPTAPEPFLSMPLTYANAFGGKLDLEQGSFAWPPNPHGKGFYLTEEQAEGRPLPNLEDPDSMIEKFDDQPEPIAPAPYPDDGSLKPLNAVDIELDAASPANAKISRLKPLFFNQAHPRMIIEPQATPRPGDLIKITNVRDDGHLQFLMPSFGLHVHVQLEDRSYVFPLHIDQIGIFPDINRVFLSHRVVFKYRMLPYERRQTTLHAGAVPDYVPDHYKIAWED